MNADAIIQPIAANRDQVVELSPRADAPTNKVSPSGPIIISANRSTPVQVGLIVLATTAFLYFARPVVLPIVLACVGGMTFKPLIRWFSRFHIPPGLSAAIVLSLVITVITASCIQFGQPALAWLNDVPQHMTQLRQRVQKVLLPGARFREAAAAVNNLGATEAEKKEEQKKIPTVQLKDDHGASSVLGWTGTFLAGAVEALLLLYLLMASGDLFLQKLVHVMPTFSDKKRAVEISREIQQNISDYLFTVTLINIGLGAIVSGGLFYLGVPNAAMWGMLVAVLNFVPYFGPVAGVLLLATVGLLNFDTLVMGFLPSGWYLLLHFLEAYIITPRLLGRRFTLNPVVIFISLIFGTWLWGTPGALLSVPILVSIKVICDRLPNLSSISELLSS